MAETTQQLLADLINVFNRAWVRPATWNQGMDDDVSVALREKWALERDRWCVNLLDLIKTWLKWPEDDADATNEQGLPSWAQNIASFKENMIRGAEVVEREILEALAGD